MSLLVRELRVRERDLAKRAEDMKVCIECELFDA